MRRALAVAVLTLVAVTGLPGAVHAGGPTSVLITEPGSGRSTALYHTSADYAALERMLQQPPTSGQLKEPPVEAQTYVNLTWMIHDVSPWRIDTVRTTPGGPAFVRTTFVSDAGGAGQDTAWREVGEPGRLAALLDRVFAAPGSGTEREAVDQQPTTSSPAAASTPRSSLAGWWWALPGALGGLLVGLTTARRRGPVQPRRELVDRAPEPASV